MFVVLQKLTLLRGGGNNQQLVNGLDYYMNVLIYFISLVGMWEYRG